jgi:hypothetical protein
VAVLAAGVEGGVLEHVRLSAQQQKTEQGATEQSRSQQETQSGGQGA